MRIPTSFQSAISDTFYDKEIEVFSVSESADTRGWGKTSKSTSLGTIDCNVIFDDLAVVQEQYGIPEKIDMLVTCSPDETILTVGCIFEYDSKMFKAVKVIPRDSHLLVIAEKWSSKSTV